MSHVSIHRIKSIIRNLITETREIVFGPIIKIDKIDASERKLTVVGKYESLYEEGTFTIVLDKRYNMVKFEVKPKS